MTGPDDVDNIDILTARYLHLEAQRQEIVQEQDAIKAEMRTDLGPGRHDTGAGHRITITPNRRFNPDLAMEKLSGTELLPLVTTETVDAKKAKTVLPPALYDACSAEVGEPRVVIK